MIPTSEIRDDCLDALAWLQVHLEGDDDGRTVIAKNCDPVALVDILTGMHLGLINLTTRGQPQMYLDALRETGRPPRREQGRRMNIKILAVHGIRSHRPVVLAVIDGYRVRWSGPHGWECDCLTDRDDLTCDHVNAMADILDDKVLGVPA